MEKQSVFNQKTYPEPSQSTKNIIQNEEIMKLKTDQVAKRDAQKKLLEDTLKKHEQHKLSREWRTWSRKGKFWISIILIVMTSALMAVGSTHVNFVNWIQLIDPRGIANILRGDEHGLWANLNNFFSFFLFYIALIGVIPAYNLYVKHWDIIEKMAYDTMINIILEAKELPDDEDIKAESYRRIKNNKFYAEFGKSKVGWGEKNIKGLIGHMYQKHGSDAVKIIDKRLEDARIAEETLKSELEKAKSVEEKAKELDTDEKD